MALQDQRAQRTGLEHEKNLPLKSLHKPGVFLFQAQMAMKYGRVIYWSFATWKSNFQTAFHRKFLGEAPTISGADRVVRAKEILYVGRVFEPSLAVLIFLTRTFCHAIPSCDAQPNLCVNRESSDLGDDNRYVGLRHGEGQRCGELPVLRLRGRNLSCGAVGNQLNGFGVKCFTLTFFEPHLSVERTSK